MQEIPNNKIKKWIGASGDFQFNQDEKEIKKYTSFLKFNVWAIRLEIKNICLSVDDLQGINTFLMKFEILRKIELVLETFKLNIYFILC